MNKKNILNALLIVFVAALAAVIYYSEETSTELGLLTRVDADTINNITIQHNNHELQLSRQLNGQQNSPWQITQPIKIAANEFRINTIIKLLNAPVHNRYRSSEIDLVKIGLENPKTFIRFDNIEIAFGITNPVTSLRFVRIGEAISTIEDVYSPLLSSHFSTLVSLNLLPGTTISDIKKLILLNQTISKENSMWQSNIDISADNINKTVDHWMHDQAFGVHQYLQRKQLGEIFIFMESSDEVISFEITDTDPWLVLARPNIGLEYHLDIEAYDKLITPQ